MKRLIRFSLLAVVLVLSVQFSYSQTCGVHCGTERWKVKSTNDTTVGTIDPTEVTKTVHWMRTRTRPTSLPNSTRLVGVERMTFKIRGVVLGYKKEHDKDFHIILAQSTNHSRTMIIEIKDVQCSDVCASSFRDQIQQAREDFIARFGMPTGSFKMLDDPVLVEIVGIGFFDRMHGQRGRALPSGLEVHPVIKFKALE